MKLLFTILALIVGYWSMGQELHDRKISNEEYAQVLLERNHREDPSKWTMISIPGSSKLDTLQIYSGKDLYIQFPGRLYFMRDYGKVFKLISDNYYKDHFAHAIGIEDLPKHQIKPKTIKP